MPPEHATVPRSEGANGFDVFQILDGERRGAHDARAVGHEHDGEGEHLVADARADDAHDGDGQKHEREREEHVEHAHDQVIEHALAVAGRQPEEQCDEAEAGEGLAVPDERAQERGEAPGGAPRPRPGPLHRQDGRHRWAYAGRARGSRYRFSRSTTRLTTTTESARKGASPGTTYPARTKAEPPHW